ncbi:family 2A encapsulin nanocompartment cargo protein cysteine desulfurase [Paraburkholderia caballeronis]|uniref:family 2A encapsulin nanocompartment cargo protein cysteine desulfurase n=1 Tax=Paraburkholderia caballeronis TaxID=416943 RepID=UPI001066CC5E|nr:family 2A encapsulin nanocompartment cargo protein cysteine desulfurase [Paraburkholderia caballeronis]TDV17245.1 cysteine desulfurase /L-selenocysteine selenide-lyase (L-alanine-forming) [Paraburkholderia caballeronis]TDV17630.1 cysteine desulfurase /L-selenocysteine selenide-lyase (L-alanine-forming) [Paraburkholderia caballeronis]TDV27648.1 cysteine desulfurase /L-selenocysteine selenide-lyase (L-alanine-forming) [Paraburkholderia caballeronis]
MTMQTPIGNPGNPAAGGALPDLPAPALPGGLPDPSMLARLATEFFSALPGGAAVPDVSAGSGAVGGVPSALPAAAPILSSVGNPVPPGSPLAGPGGAGTGVPGLSLPQGRVPGANLLPGAPTHVLSLGNRIPALAPHAAAQNGLPDSVVSIAPAFEPRAGGVALGVPEAGGLARPHVAPATGSPFYFLDDAARSAVDAPLDIAVPHSLHGNAADPRAFGLPAQSDLRELLPLHRFTPDDAARTPSRTGSLYAFDDARAAAHPRDAQRATPFASAHPPFDVHAVRRDFPILSERVNGKPLIWFDNAATTQKPQAVIDRLAYFYEHENSNIHRAAHALAGRATDAYEHARETVRRFVGASSADEIVFVRGTTEAINLIAKSWGEQNIGAGDEIVVSHLEHHANIVPWQQLAAAKGATLRVIPVDDSGQVLLDEYRKLLNARTKIVSVTQVSNALGTVVPVAEIVDLAHRAGAKALVDGAQSVSHMRVDVQALDADFFVFSGHKIFGPTGIGVVYGKREILDAMPPWQGGGNMIADVTFERTVFQPAPARFEAGTGNIADAVGLGAALDYVNRIGIENIARYEHDLLAYATSVLAPVPGVRLVGTAKDKASVLSFVLRGYETEEVGRALNEDGIAVRSGHHCAQPILRRFGLEATVRPSLAFYNTCEEVDAMVDTVRRLAARRA